MKKLFFSVFALLLALSLVSCAPKTKSFSWEEVESYYAGMEDAGIVRDGFANTTESVVISAEDAFRLAQNEHKLQPDESYAVFYDEQADMWSVSYFPKEEDVLGGTVDVYLNGKGITKLIVAGE